MAKSIKKEVVISATDKATKTLSLVAARFKNFSQQMQSVKRQTAAIGKSIGQVTAIVGGVATAVGAGIKKISDYGDEMLTLAGIVDVPVESLQKLRYAAMQNDVSAEGFDKSLQMLSKSMGELNKNQGTLYSKLSKSNPALLKQLKAANGNEEAFRVMMNAINKATTAQEKAYLATAAFGKSGQELISLANIGAEEMAKWEHEAEKFGIITEKDATAMDAMNKSIDRVKFAGQGLAATIASKLVPAITPLIEQLADWIAENRELIATKVTDMIQQLISMLKTLLAVMGPGIKIVSNFSWVLSVLFYAKLGGIILKVFTLGKTVIGLVPAFMGGIKALGLFTNGISTMSRVLAIVRGLMGKTLFSAIMSVASYIWTAVKAVWAFNAALWANPITWIVVGIIALIAAIAAAAYAIYKYWEPIKAFFAKLWDGICGVFQRAYDFIAGIFQSIKDWISESWFGQALSWVGRVTGIISDEPAKPDTTTASGDITPVHSADDLNQSQLNVATAGAQTQSADINVRFDNLPAGARVDTKTSDADLDLDIYRGSNGGTI